jgi:hypothetical protein
MIPPLPLLLIVVVVVVIAAQVVVRGKLHAISYHPITTIWVDLGRKIYGKRQWNGFSSIIQIIQTIQLK